MNNNILEFLNDSPTAFGGISSIVKMLTSKGYKPLGSKIEKGKKYYITRNDSSIIAFNIGKKLDDPSLMISASHSDCPTFKLKPNPIIKTKYGVKLNVEGYGGLLYRAYFDRPLSLAGRVMVKSKDGVCSKIFKDDEPFCIIPSMAPHLARDVEDKKPNVEKDLIPIVSLNEKYDFNQYLASKLKTSKANIISFDLYLYPLQKAYYWGDKNEFITSNHLDNLECAYTTLLGFIDNFNDNNINVYACFDNEEVGSLTMQGADSDFLYSCIQRICDGLKIDYYDLLSKAMALSCDNAHGVHPNYIDSFDLNNTCVLNGGVVVKYNANQSYTSDSFSSSLLIELMKANKIDYQLYSNKTGLRGGSTLGNLSNRHVSLPTVDIGLAQWAMHSIIETAGSKDIETMIKLIKCFYASRLVNKNGCFKLSK